MNFEALSNNSALKWLKGVVTDALGSGGFFFRVSGCGYLFSSFEFRVSGIGFRISGFGFRVQSLGSRVEGWTCARQALCDVLNHVLPSCGFRDRFRVGVRFVSDFKIFVSDFRIRVGLRLRSMEQGWGFRVQGIGYRV